MDLWATVFVLSLVGIGFGVQNLLASHTALRRPDLSPISQRAQRGKNWLARGMLIFGIGLGAASVLLLLIGPPYSLFLIGNSGERTALGLIIGSAAAFWLCAKRSWREFKAISKRS